VWERCEKFHGWLVGGDYIFDYVCVCGFVCKLGGGEGAIIVVVGCWCCLLL
jgi:hypothetical protein